VHKEVLAPLVGAFFLLDAGWWFVTGELLIPN
jgi:hypothetical protein